MSCEAATPSGDLAVGTTAVSDKPALLHSINLSNTTAAGTLVVYDHPSAASGTVVHRVSLEAGTAGGSTSMTFDTPLVCNQGITVVVAGTGAIGNVGYSLQ